MKYLFPLAIIVLAAPAYADDFGQRFVDQQPAALEDVQPQIESIAEELGVMEPAAGDEAVVEDAAEEAVSASEDAVSETEEELILSP